MGILNVTPDSFSDGGRFAAADAAIAHGHALAAAGADIIDVGGESTRPGADRVSPQVERERVVPVVAALATAGRTVSVDTTRAEVAAAALEAGAAIVNDVSGGLADPAMAPVVADARCRWILMHWRAHAAVMHQHAHYDDVVAEVQRELGARVDAALAAGVAVEHLILDPGFGFAKTASANWTLLQALRAFVGEFPLLVGVSRKSFLGELLDGRPPVDRDAATLALSVWASLQGAWGVRVHDVAATADAFAVLDRLHDEQRSVVHRTSGVLR